MSASFSIRLPEFSSLSSLADSAGAGVFAEDCAIGGGATESVSATATVGIRRLNGVVMTWAFQLGMPAKDRE